MGDFGSFDPRLNPHAAHHMEDLRSHHADNLAETEMGPMIIQEAMATLKPPRPLVLFKAPCCKPQPRVSCPDPEVTISTIQLVSLSITCIVRLDLTPNPP